MSKSTPVTCTRDVKSQFEKFLNNGIKSFTTKLMEEDDEDTTEEHLNELLSECFSTKSFKITRAPSKTRQVKNNGPKAPSNAYIQWSNAEGRSNSQKILEAPHLKKLNKMNEDELAEKYDGETDTAKILKKLVTSKDIISNAAKLWKTHKEMKDNTYTKFQSIYEEQRKAFHKLKTEAASNTDEAGPADESGNANDNTDEAKAPHPKSSAKKSKSNANSKAKANTKANTKTNAKGKADIEADTDEETDEVTDTVTESKTNAKTNAKGKAKAKANSKTSNAQSGNETDENVEEVKTYNLVDFETFDGLAIHIGMTVRGGFDTKFNKETFETLEDAVDAMNEDEDAMSINLDKNGKFTVRSSGNLVEAKTNQAPCVTWVKDDDEDSD